MSACIRLQWCSGRSRRWQLYQLPALAGACGRRKATKRDKPNGTSRLVNAKSSWTGSKKTLDARLEVTRQFVEPEHQCISVRRQCQWLGLSRSGLYYQPVGESSENLTFRRLVDEPYTRTPVYGVWRMTAWLTQQGYEITATRVRRWLRLMGLEAIYPMPHVSRAAAEHRVYPYFLTEVVIASADQVWSADMTYIRLRPGFVYVVASMDWYSRDVCAWEVSVTLDRRFCLSALARA
jgi:putative transposase